MNLKNLTNTIENEWNQNKSSILTGISVGTTIGGVTYMLTNSIPKTVETLKEHEKELEESQNKKLDTVKLCYKYYLVPFSLFGISIGTCIGSNLESVKKNMALASAYLLAENRKSKTKETPKESSKTEDNPSSVEDVVIGHSYVTVCDEFNGRFFKASVKDIREIEARANQILVCHMRLSLNDFYGELGLMPTDSAEGYGWRCDEIGMRCLPVEVTLEGGITKTGEPYIKMITNATRYDDWF